LIQGETDKPWTPSEVDAAVQAYFGMWTDWPRGLHVNKAQRVGELEALLSARNRSSVEYKFRNISSVTFRSLDVWLEGYRPLVNIQRDLERAVAEYLASHGRVLELLQAHRASVLPAPLPGPAPTEDLLVPPPVGGRRSAKGAGGLATGRLGAIDEFRRRELGRNGEEFVMLIERESLLRAGRKDLAERILWTSEEFGDGFGYDIASFKPDGSPVHIEVKTTNFGIRTPFYITRNEVNVSATEPELFSLYRVFNFRRGPLLYRLYGSVADTANLDPYVYIGSPR
jgi:hypothetical protein